MLRVEALPRCRVPADGIHVWMLIDRVEKGPRILYLFACRYCLGSLGLSSEEIDIIEREPAHVER